MLMRLLVFVEIARPHNMFLAALAAAAGYFIAGGRSVAEGAPVALFTFLVTGAGYIINDCFDVGIDRINKPARPLPSGRMSGREAAVLYAAVTTLATIGAIVFLPRSVAALVVAWEIGLFVYARWAKRMFVVGNVLVAAIVASVFLAGGLLAGDVGSVLVPIVLAFVFNLSREIVKGAEDVDGDRLAGARTAAVVVGRDRVLSWAYALLLLLAAAIPLPAMTQYFGKLYLWVMELAVVPGMVLSAYLIATHPQRHVFRRVSTILKIEMFFGILAVGLGKV